LDGYKARVSYHQRHRTFKAFDAKCHQLGGDHRETLQPDEFATSWAHFGKSGRKGTCTQITLPVGPKVPPHAGYTKCVDPYDKYIGSSLEADHYRLPFVGEYQISRGPQCGDTHGSNPGRYQASKEAIDFATPVGTPIYAARAGTVDASYNSGDNSFGELIIIKHDNVKKPGNVEYSYYAHLSNRLAVSEGVTQGELIGYSGATGNITGPHLHFEVRAESNGNAKPDDNDEAVPIREIPGIFWYNGNPEDPCRWNEQYDGVGIGAPV
jgi:hypothetical protein